MTMVCVSTQPDHAYLMVDSIASDEPVGRRFQPRRRRQSPAPAASRRGGDRSR